MLIDPKVCNKHRIQIANWREAWYKDGTILVFSFRTNTLDAMRLIACSISGAAPILTARLRFWHGKAKCSWVTMSKITGAVR